MLLQLYPKVHRRYTSLPVLGSIMEGFGAWLLKHGYSTDCIREHFCAVRRLSYLLHHQGIGSETELTRAKLQACAPASRLDDHRLNASVHLLDRYLESETCLYPVRPLSRIEQRVATYATYLDQVRGLVASTVAAHCSTATALLADIEYESSPNRLCALTAMEVEGFIRRNGVRVKRRALQTIVAHVRGFLRFMASSGETARGTRRLTFSFPPVASSRTSSQRSLPHSMSDAGPAGQPRIPPENSFQTPARLIRSREAG